MMLQPTSAPGRAQPAQPGPAQPVPAEQAPPPGETGEPPPQGSPGGFSGMLLVAPFLLLFVFIFLMNRGEKKKRAKLEAQLKKGDRVITRSGIKGKLVELSTTTAKVEIAPGVHVTMVKAAIEGLDPGEATSSSSAGKDDDSAAKTKKK